MSSKSSNLLGTYKQSNPNDYEMPSTLRTIRQNYNLIAPVDQMAPKSGDHNSRSMHSIRVEKLESEKSSLPRLGESTN